MLTELADYSFPLLLISSSYDRLESPTNLMIIQNQPQSVINSTFLWTELTDFYSASLLMSLSFAYLETSSNLAVCNNLNLIADWIDWLFFCFASNFIQFSVSILNRSQTQQQVMPLLICWLSRLTVLLLTLLIPSLLFFLASTTNSAECRRGIPVWLLTELTDWNSVTLLFLLHLLNHIQTWLNKKVNKLIFLKLMC